jgi:hypothetical protein
MTHLLDTSAILAHYLDEPGADEVERLLAQGPRIVALAAPSWVELDTRLREAGRAGKCLPAIHRQPDHPPARGRRIQPCSDPSAKYRTRSIALGRCSHRRSR